MLIDAVAAAANPDAPIQSIHHKNGLLGNIGISLTVSIQNYLPAITGSMPKIALMVVLFQHHWGPINNKLALLQRKSIFVMAFLLSM